MRGEREREREVEAAVRACVLAKAELHLGGVYLKLAPCAWHGPLVGSCEDLPRNGLLVECIGEKFGQISSSPSLSFSSALFILERAMVRSSSKSLLSLSLKGLIRALSLDSN